MAYSVQELRDFLLEGRAQLLKRDPVVPPGRGWLDEHTALIDETLRRLYQTAWEEARKNDSGGGFIQSEHENGLALLALGGYGRGDLCPYSDIDIAFITAEEEHPVLDAVIKEGFRLIVEVFIDGARLDVGYAYRPISDCVRLDHTGKTALLEARRVAGSDRLLHAMIEELFSRWDGVEFLLDQVAARRAVAARVPMSLFAVEPHIKEGAGALREIHAALWVAGAVLRTTAPLRELEWRGVVTAADCAEVVAARDFMLRLRTWLHLSSGKKNDVFNVEFQDRCARGFGYLGAGATPAQALLSDYYRHAQAVLRFSNKVMRRLLEGPLPLDGHFVAEHRHVHAAHPYTLRNHPELTLTPFVLARKYGFGTDSELDRCIEDALPLIEPETRRHPIMRGGFLALLHDVGMAADALTELRARGVLQAFMPEFETMLNLAPADPSHQLTVGEHSIYAVRVLGDLWQRRRDDDELHDVWSGVEDTELLVLGTLLHDVGKIEPGTDHSLSGARLVTRIGARLGLSQERIDRLALLVRRHLLLPRVARLRDLSAPGTIREVMKKARDVSTLKMLYLLSLADTCAVGERAYSPLELEGMRELYERALLAMTRAETAEVLTDMEKREQMVQRERERLRREMRRFNLDDATLHLLCDNLPAAYVLNTPLTTIATHLKLLEQLPQEQVIVDTYPDADNSFTELTIMAYDDEKPGLLSKVCGVLTAAGAEILTAHVYTVRARDLRATQRARIQNGDGGALSPLLDPQEGRDIVLDRLHIATNGRALTAARGARLAVLLREVLLGHKSVEDVLKAANKPTSQELTPVLISARNDLSDEHSVATVVCDNVPGLLYYVTHAFAAAGLDIHTAKITTWEGRAEDAFYVTRRGPAGHGEKIPDDDLEVTLTTLREKLQKP